MKKGVPSDRGAFFVGSEKTEGAGSGKAIFLPRLPTANRFPLRLEVL